VLKFSGWHLTKSLFISRQYGWASYVAHQVYYSLVGCDYEQELMPLGLDQKIGALVWSPLGSDRLTGRLRRDQPIPEKSRLHSTAESGPPWDARNRRDRTGSVKARQNGSTPMCSLFPQ
jgi:aryl-alcohol dehydrogenase-like predicted oxidoreductase